MQMIGKANKVFAHWRMIDGEPQKTFEHEFRRGVLADVPDELARAVEQSRVAVPA